MQNTANLVYLLLSIIATLLAGGVWLISTLLKYQRESLESKHRAELTDITLSGNLKDQDSTISGLVKDIQLLTHRVEKLESRSSYHHRLLWKNFPEDFKRGTDS